MNMYANHNHISAKRKKSRAILMAKILKKQKQQDMTVPFARARAKLGVSIR